MKKQLIALLFLGSVLFLSSCKKDDDDNGSGGVPSKEQLSEQQAQFSDDANDYRGESDQADNDINQSMQDNPNFEKMGSANYTGCGYTIDDSTAITGNTVYFNFDGTTTCFTPARKRSGTIKVELVSGNSWSEAGAVVEITYINYKVTKVSNGSTIEFDGSKRLTNVNGHNWIEFFAGVKTYKYKEEAFNMMVTYNSGQTATWNCDRTTEWSYNLAQGIVFKADGDTTVNGYAHTDSWGTTRYGGSFVISYSSPWESNTICGLWKPTSGVIVHHMDSGNYTITLGVNQSGIPTPTSCGFGFKVTWVATNGNSGTAVISYK
jgi:hypothetical protein